MATAAVSASSQIERNEEPMPLHPQHRPSRLSALAGIALLGLTLGACNQRSVDVTASIPSDYRERHPIVLSEAPRTIEIFAGSGYLDARERDDLAAFAAEYRQHGRSHIVAEVPSHEGRGGNGHSGLHAIRKVLAGEGVAPSLISVRGYPAGDHTAARPIRLSYARLQAGVPGPCGLWPEDLGSSGYRFSASNRSYHNFGCATQNNLAAFVADPLDLQRARPETRIDTARRMTAIGKLRQGQDPSTSYRDSATRINQTVGN
jgi:pilus assembly protein CpaD